MNRTMRQLDFIGSIQANADHFSKRMVLPGRDELIVAPEDWPIRLVPGTLNIGLDDELPKGFDGNELLLEEVG